MPCLNEASTLAICIDKARNFLERNNIQGEVIVADNGSTDGSQSLAEAHGARVINVVVRGYGAALMGGINSAIGKYVIMGDADDSYDFAELTPFVAKLREGYEFVIGNRFKGGIKPGAMPKLNRYLGTPVITGLGRLFFRAPIGDFNCGLRGFDREAIQRLDLQTTGMEFASEMIVKAALHELRITEVPTTLSPDGRNRPPHLRRWHDGWRHLRFLLIYSPRWLFLYPGMTLIALGLIMMFALVSGPKTIKGITFDIHTMLYSSIMVIVGLQTVAFSLFASVYAMAARLLPENSRIFSLLKSMTLERGLILGSLSSLVGLTGSIYAFIIWGRTSFGGLIPSSMMRIVIPSLTLLAVGIQIIFAAFFLSVLALKRK